MNQVKVDAFDSSLIRAAILGQPKILIAMEKHKIAMRESFVSAVSFWDDQKLVQWMRQTYLRLIGKSTSTPRMRWPSRRRPAVLPKGVRAISLLPKQSTYRHTLEVQHPDNESTISLGGASFSTSNFHANFLCQTSLYCEECFLINFSVF